MEDVFADVSELREPNYALNGFLSIRAFLNYSSVLGQSVLTKGVLAAFDGDRVPEDPSANTSTELVCQFLVCEFVPGLHYVNIYYKLSITSHA
jgi:hypothetical protein